MGHKQGQLGFELKLKPADEYRLDRFYEGSYNRVPLGSARSFGIDAHKSLVITGGKGNGKSHLLKGIFYAREKETHASYLSAGRFTEAEAGKAVEAVKRLEDFNLVCIDDIDSQSGNLPFFDALFHLFNALVAKGGYLAVTMDISPARAGYLPDYLSSRLLSGMVVRISEPDDDDRKGIIEKLAADRQMKLPQGGLEYILERAPRSVGSLAELMDVIRDSAESGNSGIGLQLIRRVVKSKLP